MTSPLLKDRVIGKRIARGGDVPVTRSCTQPTPDGRYRRWIDRHPNPASIFARRLFEAKQQPENENGTQDETRQ